MGRIWVALFLGVCLGVLGDLCLGSAQIGNYGRMAVNSSSLYGMQPAYLPRRNYSSSWNEQRNNSTVWNSRRYPRSMSSGTRSFYWGTYSPHDRTLYTTRVMKDKMFMRKVSLEVDFPSQFQTYNATIHYIQAIDQGPEGEGGFVSILKGGVGDRSVTLQFTSQRNYDIDFNVIIYGR